MKKKLMAAVTVCTLSVASLSGAAFAHSGDFTDVKADFWAKPAIHWGAQQGAINGYEDGSFKPDKKVSEVEFLSMFIRAFKKDLPVSAADWSEPAYTFAKSNNYPALGLSDADAKSVSITRTQVAEIIAAASGYHFEGDDAVAYLLDAGYSSGKKSATIEGYAGQDPLTRAEAIQFIKNLNDKGFSSLGKRPRGKLSWSNLQSAKAVTQAIETLASAQPEYTVDKDSYSLTISKNENALITWVWYTPDWGDWNEIGIYDVTDPQNVELAVGALKASGISVDDSLKTALEETNKSGEDRELKVGDYKLNLVMGYVMNNVSIIISKADQ